MAEDGIKTGSIVVNGALAIGDGATAISGATQPDFPALERAYLERLISEIEFLRLQGLSGEVKQDQVEARVSLEAVYTAMLVTLAPRDALRKKPQEGDRERAPASALQAVDGENRLVLLGLPGSGKSTFVNFLTLCLARERAEEVKTDLALLRAPLPDDEGVAKGELQPWRHGALLPLPIVLRDFAASGLVDGTAQSLAKFVQNMLGAAEQAELWPHLKTLLTAGEAIVLLDGLDEVPLTGDQRRLLVDSVQGFVKSFGRSRFLVTSRVMPYRGQGWRLEGFGEAELLPFSPGQIRAFVRAWYKYSALARTCRFDPAEAGDRAEVLLDRLLSDRRLGDLAERPLLLTLIAIVDSTLGQLPDDRHDLYYRTVNLLLETWERRRFRKDQEQSWVLQDAELTRWFERHKKAVRAALARLAFEAHALQEGQEGTADVPLDRLRALLEDIDPKFASQPLRHYLNERAGILLERGQGILTFPHRSFQEYLAAEHLNNAPAFLPGAEEETYLEDLARRDPDRWSEVLLLAIASLNSARSQWERVRLLATSENRPGCEVEDQIGVVLAGEVLAEVMAAKEPGPKLTETVHAPVWRQLDRVGRETLERVREGLGDVMTGSILKAPWRARSGQALGRLGDPRFSAQRWYLPIDADFGFLRVPAGKFWRGSDRYEDEGPPGDVDLPEFWIARYPVTVAQFRAFVEDTGFVVGDRDCLIGEPFAPAVWIDHAGACAYGQWLLDRLKAAGSGAGWHEALLDGELIVRLPVEEEWEKSARGSADRREHPWSGEASGEKANFDESGINRVSVVGCFPEGRSPLGCDELVGNVWEWTLSPWRERYDLPLSDKKAIENAARVVRGGSSFLSRYGVRCASRDYGLPSRRYDLIGFRLVLAPFSLASAFL